MLDLRMHIEMGRFWTTKIRKIPFYRQKGTSNSSTEICPPPLLAEESWKPKRAHQFCIPTRSLQPSSPHSTKHPSVVTSIEHLLASCGLHSQSSILHLTSKVGALQPQSVRVIHFLGFG
ncbi:hypothetical protein BDN72DRAFT_851341 [Pluteus cervinus]|uniref:Uncharacterized protein n=1 Tax=Pluteus cervinus TaxID=181527 RepID=A0ACD3A0Y0_9AGAR|nr:hypothetical protein BDN72DRAFT_851341 [Pluteus cervinus]